MSYELNMSYKAKIKQSATGPLYLWFSEPQNDDFQEIQTVKINHKPKSEYFDEQGNKILFFEFDESEVNFEADIRGKLLLENERTVTRPKNLDRFLAEEKYLEKTDLVKEIADLSSPEPLKGVFDYILKNFKYCYPVYSRGVSNLKPGSLQGDCGEYSSLFVAVARNLKLPANNESGFVIHPKENSITEHAWARAYLDKWQDFDTQYGQQESDPYIYFGRRTDYRISFCHGFNIPLKPTLPQNFDLSLWKEIGLPVENNSVQIMQPIFFAGKNKVEFEEEITLK